MILLVTWFRDSSTNSYFYHLPLPDTPESANELFYNSVSPILVLEFPCIANLNVFLLEQTSINSIKGM